MPYTVWGNDTKVVLRVPTELKYHDVSIDQRPLTSVKTAWVSYNFEDEHGQSMQSVPLSYLSADVE